MRKTIWGIVVIFTWCAFFLATVNAAPQLQKEKNSSRTQPLPYRQSKAYSAKKKVVPEEEKIRVFLPELSTVKGESYTLGEVARLEGEDPLLIEKLSQLTIGRSPVPGSSQVLTNALLQSRLRPHTKDGQIVFSAATSTKVQRAALRVPGEDVDRAVLEYIKKEYSGQEIKPKLLSRSRDVFLPHGELIYEIKEQGKHKKEGGYRTYGVMFRIDEKLAKTISVRVYLKVYKDIYVAKDTIKKDHVIEEIHLQKVRRNIDRLPAAYITDKESVVGKIAKRVIGPREVLKSNVLETPPIIESGERLMIVYESPYLRLTAPGIALSKGGLGERIPVRNLESKTVVYAKIKTSKLVQVN